MSIDAVDNLLALAGVGPGGRFVDLGSGLGKAVGAAALTHPELESALGVEILPELHARSAPKEYG